MKWFLIPLALVAVIGMTGCSGMNDTQQRTLSGGAAGAVGGAIGGAVLGCIWCGAVVGGGLGAAGGYVYDQLNKDDQPKQSAN